MISRSFLICAYLVVTSNTIAQQVNWSLFSHTDGEVEFSQFMALDALEGLLTVTKVMDESDTAPVVIVESVDLEGAVQASDTIANDGSLSVPLLVFAATDSTDLTHLLFAFDENDEVLLYVQRNDMDGEVMSRDTLLSGLYDHLLIGVDHGQERITLSLLNPLNTASVRDTTYLCSFTPTGRLLASATTTWNLSDITYSASREEYYGVSPFGIIAFDDALQEQDRITTEYFGPDICSFGDNLLMLETGANFHQLTLADSMLQPLAVEQYTYNPFDGRNDNQRIGFSYLESAGDVIYTIRPLLDGDETTLYIEQYDDSLQMTGVVTVDGYDGGPDEFFLFCQNALATDDGLYVAAAVDNFEDGSVMGLLLFIGHKDFTVGNQEVEITNASVHATLGNGHIRWVNSLASDVEIQLFDTSGRLVATRELRPGVTIDVVQQHSGIYYYAAIDQKGRQVGSGMVR